MEVASQECLHLRYPLETRHEQLIYWGHRAQIVDASSSEAVIKDPV